MALSTAECADLLQTTLAKYRKLEYTDIATDLQEYMAMPQLLKKEQVRFEGGTSVDWRIRVDTTGTARMTGLFAVDDLAVSDVFTDATIPWRFATGDWSVERREINMNRSSAERLINLIEERENDAMTDMAILMETQFWGGPSASTNTTSIYGVKYWIIRHITGTSASNTDGIPGGLNGAGPWSANSIAGVDCSVHTNFKNWTFKYTDVTSSDAIRSWRKASTFCKFKAPVPHPTLDRGRRYGYYTLYHVVSALEEAVQAQNDNLGNDVASKDGTVLFRSNPVTWVPYLEADSTDCPIYGIDWGVFYPVFLTGEYMVRSKPEPSPNQHTVIKTHVDCTLNMKCVDRRRLFVGSKDVSGIL